MHIARQAVLSALAAVGAFGVVTTGLAQQAASPQKVEKVEVTGSNIKRVDVETVAPVTVITRDDIERSGKPTISEVLRGLPQNGGQSYSETFTNSFSPGASGIALRGLSQKSTLVLINGRRMSTYGFAQNLFDTYVDLNSIPASAVERIEILRDGASAVYGSDAIAGVVNIILRKDYRGLEFGGSAGTSSEGGLDEKRANLAFGFGDLSKNRFNIMGAIDYYKRDELLLSERAFTRDQDFRNRDGGTLTRATVAAYYAFNGLSNANGRTPLSTCPASSQIAANILNSALSGTTCAYNAASFGTLFPYTERIGFISRAAVDFTPTLQGFAELALSSNESSQHGTPAQVANGTGLLVFNPATGGVRTISNTLQTNNPSNPFGRPINILYSFFDVGGRDTKVTSDSGRVLAGLKGNLGNWDWEVGVGSAKTTSESKDFNGINADVLNTAIANGTYNFLSPGSGTVTARELRIDQVRKSESKLNFADFKASSELMMLPSGPLGFAAGADFRKEEIDDVPDANLAAGRVLARGFTRTKGDRSSSAAYVEFSIPLNKQVELQAAARYDRYSDFGSATSPKVGFKWVVSKEFLLRGSVSRGFRAPTLPEATQTNALSFTTVVDPVNGNRAFNIAQLAVSNPGLLPEKSKSSGFGMVWEPLQDLAIGLDFYKIRQNNLVTRDSNAFIIREAAAGNPFFAPRVVRDPATGLIIYTVRQVRNLDFIQTSGIDIEAKKIFRVDGLGKFTLSASYNYVDTFNTPGFGPGTAVFNYVDSNGFGAIPRYKGNIGLNWDISNWSSNLTYRYIHSYEQAFGPPAGAVGVQNLVGSYYDIDGFVAYTGFKNLKLTASVRNMLNREPRWDSSGGAIGIDFTQYDHRGRYYTVGASYSFK